MIKSVEPVEMEDVETLPRVLRISEIPRWERQQEEIDLFDLPRAEFAELKIRIDGKINIRVRFAQTLPYWR